MRVRRVDAGTGQLLIERSDEGCVIDRHECHDAGMAIGDHASLVYADKASRKLAAEYCLVLWFATPTD